MAVKEITVTFGGKMKIDAQAGAFTIHTDQPTSVGGDGTAPEPYTLFLASLATCAGIYVKSFCDARELDSSQVKLVQRMIPNEDGKGLATIAVDIQIPASFPEKYVDALVRSANFCAVKKTILNPPKFDIKTVVVG